MAPRTGEGNSMRARMIIGGVLVAASLGATVSALAAPATGPVPAACVVVTGPNGATVQAGYAPNGPDDCTQLP